MLPFSRLSRLLVLLAFAGAGLVGCDSEDPVAIPTPEDLEGLYDFTEYRFVPDASAVEPANVLDTLVAAQTSMELFGSGRVIFRYKVEEEPSNALDGSFDLNATQLRLRLVGEGALTRLLLTSPLIFERNDEAGRLTLDQETTANLAAYDPDRYEGLNSVDGTLMITLVRRSE